MREDLFPPEAAGEYIGLKRSTLAKLRSVGGGPRFLRVGGGRGGRVFYLKEDLDTYLVSRRMASTASDTRPS